MVYLFSSYHSVKVLSLQFAVTLILYCSRPCFSLSNLQKPKKRLLVLSGLCICQSVRIEQLGSSWTDFYEIWYFSIFLNICSQNSSFIKIWREKRVLYMRTCEHFSSYPAQFFWEWEMFQTQFVDKIKTHFMFSNFFPPKLCCLWNNVKEYCGARQATDDNITRHMRILSWVPNATDTYSEYLRLIGQNTWSSE